MASGETTAARGLANWKRLVKYLKAEVLKPWFTERLSTFKGEEIIAVAHQQDKDVAITQVARLRMEHTDTFCVARDHLYARRYRKWLYSKAYWSKIDGNYELWAVFVRENMPIPLDKVLARAEALEGEAYTVTMKSDHKGSA